MNIKIKSITLRNFKGLRDVSFDFDGRNATIIGDNGTGKTTIFDALTWVLFGKDSHNSTDIDIKTIDATGEPMHRAEHFVEVALDVDGSTQTLRRTYREIWSKPRGSSDLRFVGHESAFAVNGVEVGTKAAYDKIISEWINDDVFRMLTDPMYFNTRVDWKGRRAALLALVGDNIDRTEIQARFAVGRQRSRLRPQIRVARFPVPALCSLPSAASCFDMLRSSGRTCRVPFCSCAFRPPAVL